MKQKEGKMKHRFVLLLCSIWLMWGIGQGAVWAEDVSNPFAIPTEKALDIFTKAKKVIVVLSGIAVLILSLYAFFGDFKWGWLASLAGGLILLLISGSLITYFSGEILGR